jgi:hypothetical protein
MEKLKIVILYCMGQVVGLAVEDDRHDEVEFKDVHISPIELALMRARDGFVDEPCSCSVCQEEGVIDPTAPESLKLRDILTNTGDEAK